MLRLADGKTATIQISLIEALVGWRTNSRLEASNLDGTAAQYNGYMEFLKKMNAIMEEYLQKPNVHARSQYMEDALKDLYSEWRLMKDDRMIVSQTHFSVSSNHLSEKLHMRISETIKKGLQPGGGVGFDISSVLRSLLDASSGELSEESPNSPTSSQRLGKANLLDTVLLNLSIPPTPAYDQSIATDSTSSPASPLTPIESDDHTMIELLSLDESRLISCISVCLILT